MDGRAGVQGADELAGVDGGGAHHGVGHGLAKLLVVGLELLDAPALDGNPAHERVAVGVDAGAREAQNDVAGLDLLGTDHLRSVDDAHHEAGEVVVVRVHDAGVLGHLAAHEGAAALLAAVGDALDDLRHVLGAQLADGNVVKEEQGLGADGHHVVHAHGHEVLAHRVVTVQQLGDGKLGAHAVGARYHHGVFHVLERCGREAPAKAAEATDDLGTVRLLHGGLDGINRAGALSGIDAGVLVGHVLVVAHERSFRGLDSRADLRRALRRCGECGHTEGMAALAGETESMPRRLPRRPRSCGTRRWHGRGCGACSRQGTCRPRNSAGSPPDTRP